MGLSSPKLLIGNVMHGRLFPRKNHFRYSIFYLAIPLSRRNSLPIPYNRRGMMSFHDKDHANGSGGDLDSWARRILSSYAVKADGEIVLICMPRILGYVFNPVSFWLCHGKDGSLKAVLCEVHNTFGEKHTYLCAHEDGRSLSSEEILTARKVFHVSPFLERKGSYAFRFESTSGHFATWIDYYDEQGNKQLVTSLTGKYIDMTKSACMQTFWRYPLITFKAIFLIHYQAVKLVLKKVRYVPKPLQNPEKISATANLTKM